jgi:hypothetical protein
MKRLAVLAILGILGAGKVRAAVITITETVTATGSLGGTAYNGLVTITATGDTNGVVPYGPNLIGFNNTSATVTVEGIATATFTALTLGFVNQSSVPGAGIELGAVNNPNPADILDVRNPAFSTYNLTSSIGPLTGTPVFEGPSSYATTLGVFSFTSFLGNATYQAVVTAAVPEPTSLTLAGIGGVIGVGCARRVRREANAA